MPKGQRTDNLFNTIKNIAAHRFKSTFKQGKIQINNFSLDGIVNNSVQGEDKTSISHHKTLLPMQFDERQSLAKKILENSLSQNSSLIYYQYQRESDDGESKSSHTDPTTKIVLDYLRSDNDDKQEQIIYFEPPLGEDIKDEEELLKYIHAQSVDDFLQETAKLEASMVICQPEIITHKPDFSSITPNRPLILVGCGNMGEPLLRGWLDQGMNADAIHVVTSGNENKDRQRRERFPGVNVGAIKSLPERDKIQPKFIVFAVKPQQISKVLALYKDYVNLKYTTIVSVLAGTPTEIFTSAFGEKVAVVRAMPNLPSSIGQGMTGAYMLNVDNYNRRIAVDLLGAIGKVELFDNEKTMNAVTAVSGSGPGFVFALLEAYVEAAKSLGFNEEQATNIVYQTFLGSVQLAMEKRNELTVSQLRRNVTSPNGTTQQGLSELLGVSQNTLKEDKEKGQLNIAETNLTKLLKAVLEATQQRGVELGSGKTGPGGSTPKNPDKDGILGWTREKKKN